MKFEENWPRGFRGEVVQRCGWTDRQVVTTAHPDLCSGELKNPYPIRRLCFCALHVPRSGSFLTQIQSHARIMNCKGKANIFITKFGRNIKNHQAMC